MEDRDDMTFHSSILQVASLIKNNKKQKDDCADTSETEKEKKRERSANFAQEETERLVELVEAKKDIIESKKNGAEMWVEKKNAWKEIEKKFNKKVGAVYRNDKNLKLKYEALKRDLRKKQSSISRGKLKVRKLSRIEKKVMEMMQMTAEDVFDDSDPMNDMKSDESSDASRSSCDTKEFEWPLIKKEKDNAQSDHGVDQGLHYVSESKSFPIELEASMIDVEPSSKRMRHDPLEKPIHNESSSRRLSLRLLEEQIEAAQLQKQVFKQELEIKAIQKKMLEEEIEHKGAIAELEKQHLQLKINLLKAELE